MFLDMFEYEYESLKVSGYLILVISCIYQYRLFKVSFILLPPTNLNKIGGK